MLVWDFFHNVRRVHRSSAFERFQNRDLLITLSNLYDLRTGPTYVLKVRAHCGNPFNELADALAKAAAEMSPT